MKLYNAKITEISDRGVRVTGYRLPKPDERDLILNYDPDIDNYEWHPNASEIMRQRIAEYEASKFTAWVENVFDLKDVEVKDGIIIVPLGVEIDRIVHHICLNQSCQVIETETGCKIVELNK